jgi:hypothetical protein
LGDESALDVETRGRSAPRVEIAESIIWRFDHHQGATVLLGPLPESGRPIQVV